MAAHSRTKPAICLGVGDLAAVAGQRLHLEVNGLRDVHVGVGIGAAAEVDLAHPVRRQPGVGFGNIGGGAGGGVDGVVQGYGGSAVVGVIQIEVVECRRDRFQADDDVRFQAPQHVDQAVTQLQVGFQPPVGEVQENDLLDAHNAGGDALLRLADVGHFRP